MAVADMLILEFQNAWTDQHTSIMLCMNLTYTHFKLPEHIEDVFELAFTALFFFLYYLFI